MSVQPEYLSEQTVIFRECPCVDCTAMLEANSHAKQVKALHDHLREEHTWAEKQQWM